MKVLIDTNILLDVLYNRPGLIGTSKTVWKLCEAGKLDGTVCALSVVNISCIMRKQLTPLQVRAVVKELDVIFRISGLEAADLRMANLLPMNDVEDAVQAACAQRVGAQFIVTRNLKDFSNSPVSAIKPEELLAMFD